MVSHAEQHKTPVQAAIDRYTAIPHYVTDNRKLVDVTLTRAGRITDIRFQDGKRA